MTERVLPISPTQGQPGRLADVGRLNALHNLFITADGTGLVGPTDLESQSTQHVLTDSNTDPITVDFDIAPVWVITMTKSTHIIPAGGVIGRTCTLRIIFQWDGQGVWTPFFTTPRVTWPKDAEANGTVTLWPSGLNDIADILLTTTNGGATWTAVILNMSPTGAVSPTGGPSTSTIPASGPIAALSFSTGLSEYKITMDQDCSIQTHVLAIPGSRMKIFLYQDSVGGHLATFPDVTTWLGNLKPTSPMQAAVWEIDIYVLPDGTIAGQITPAFPQTPDPPRLLTLTPSATGMNVTWQAPRISGDDAAPINHYNVYLVQHATFNILQTITPVSPSTFTATFSGLTSLTTYDVWVSASTTLHGEGPVLNTSATTLSSGGTVVPPTVPTNVGGFPGDTAAIFAWSAPTNSGGATVSYKFTMTGPGSGAGTVTQVQKKIANITTPAAGITLSATMDSPLTAGNKLIVVVSDNSFTDGGGLGRRVTSTGGNPTFYVLGDNTDCHVEIWDRDITVNDGTPTITYSLGAGAAPQELCMTIYEYSGLGARATAAPGDGPQRFNVSHFQAGTTGTLDQAAMFAIAAWSTGANNLTGSYVLSDGTDAQNALDSAFSNTASPKFTALDSNLRQFTAKCVNTTGTTPLSVTLRTTVASDGTGIIGLWKVAGTGGGGFSLTDNAATSPKGVSGLVNGTTYTAVLKAHNSAGDSAGVTVTVTPVTSTTIPVITTTSTPGATVGTSYTLTLAATQGVAPYTWAISAGSLPAGLSLNAGTGIISGKPTTSGTSSFTVQVTDTKGSTDTQALSIVVSPQASGSGGTAAVKAHIGQALNGGDAQFFTPVENVWGFPFFYDNTYIDMDGSTNGANANISGYGFRGGPITVSRCPVAQQAGGGANLIAVAGGAYTAASRANGAAIQRLSDLQGGVAQWIRIVEWDGDWFGWAIGNANGSAQSGEGLHNNANFHDGSATVNNFCAAVRKVVTDIRAGMTNPAMLKVDLCGGLGLGEGWGVSHSALTFGLWDAVMAQIGDIIDGVGVDAYSNGTPAAPFLDNALAATKAKVIAYGKKFTIGEWGIATAATESQYGGSGPNNYDNVAWTNTWLNFLKGLPASGPGSLAYWCLFDEAAPFPQGRGVRLIPVDGPRVMSAIQAGLA